MPASCARAADLVTTEHHGLLLGDVVTMQVLAPTCSAALQTMSSGVCTEFLTNLNSQ